jgi:CHAT domain-containing protein
MQCQEDVAHKIDSIRQSGFDYTKQVTLFEALKRDDIRQIDRAFIHYYLGHRYERLNFFRQSIKHSEDAIRLFHDIDFEGYQLPYAYSKLGDAYFNLGKYNQALETYKKIESLELKGKGYNALANGVRVSAEIYLSRGEYKSAIQLIEYVDQFKEHFHIEDYSKLMLVLSLNYSNLDSIEIEKSKQALQLSIDSNFNIEKNTWRSPSRRLYQMLQAAFIEDRSGNYWKSNELYKQTLDFAKKESPNDLLGLSVLHTNIAYNLLQTNQTESALHQARTAKSLFSNSMISLHPDRYLLILDNLSLSFLRNNQIDSAEYYNSKALEFVDDNTSQQVSLYKEHIDLLFNKSKIEVARSIDSKSNSLNEAIKNLSKMDGILDQYIKQTYFESSAINLKTKYHDYYKDAIELSYEANDLHAFWHFSEKSKNILLLDAILTKTKWQSPDENRLTQIKEKEIQLDYALEGNLDTIQKDSVRQLIANNRKNQVELLEQLKNETSFDKIEITDYESFKNKISNNCFVQYQFGKQFLYALIVNDQRENIIQLEKSTRIKQTLNSYLQLLQQPSFDENKLNAIDNLSHQLYQLLVEPLNLTCNQIIISTDEELALLPFEALQVSTENNDFLIKHLVIQYVLSGSFLFQKNRTNNVPVAVKHIIPEYEYSENSTGLTPLPFADEESQTLIGLFKSTKSSTKNEFIKGLEQGEIIHFSGHAILNEEDNNKSYLAFSNSSALSDKLTLAELYNKRSDSPFINLAACNTASGKILYGEGISSLSRGLLYSGVQSVKSTMWAVNDKSSSEISNAFYTYLKKGESKSSSLHKAKLDFLQTASDENKHPYYWAGIRIYGNDNALSFKRKINIPLVLATCLFVLILIFYWQKS